MKPPVHVHATRVAFGDTDCSGWLHFPKIFRHVEEAEHAFLRRRGISIISRESGGWPRVHVSCDFRKPLLFDDEIEVRLAIARIGGASVEWEFEIARGGEVCACGKMTTVRVNGHGRPETIDEETRAKLEG